MKQQHLLAILLCLALTFACKKEKKSDTEPAIDNPVSSDVSSYSQLKTGNSWIYQEFKIDSLDNATPTATYDSCYIEKDTVIRGNTYFKMMKPFYSGNPMIVSFLRDSADCIVNSTGQIRLSTSNFSSPVSTSYFLDAVTADTVWKAVIQMTDKDMAVTVPAGVFTTVNAKQAFYIYPKMGGSVKYQNNRYARNVGVVSEVAVQYAAHPVYYERRLVRYHLK